MSVADAAALVKAVSAVRGIELSGVTTHLHGIGSAAYLDWQLQSFQDVLDTLELDGLRPAIRLAESSATLGTAVYPGFNAVDPGHLLYGLVPRGRVDRPAWSRPALRSVTTRVLQVRSVDRQAFVAESPVADAEPIRIGVIPMGVADGLRALCSGEVLVRGTRCRVVGAMSLEHTRVDLSAVPEARRGDEVVIVGRQGDEEITAEDVERANGLGSAGLGIVAAGSVSRHYVKTGTHPTS